MVSRLNITLPGELASDFRRTVPRRERSKLIAEALEEKLARIRREKAFKNLKGAWDKAGGVKFSTDREISSWRKKLWSEFDRKFASR